MATRQGESGAAALADLARPTIDDLAVPGAVANAPRLPRVPFASSLGLLAATVPLLLFLVLPLGVLLWRTASVGRLAEYLASPIVAAALRLSLLTTAATVLLAVGLGTPIAYLLARYRFPGRALVDTLLDLPMVLPPAVAGVALLMTLGRRGLLGPPLAALDVEIGFTTTAVVLAQLFIAAPFYVKAAKHGFEAVDPALEQVAAISGASALQTFRYVTVPLALPAPGRRGDGLGAGARRVRRHDHVRRQLPRRHADDAAGDLRGDGARPGRRPRPLQHPRRGVVPGPPGGQGPRAARAGPAHGRRLSDAQTTMAATHGTQPIQL